MPQKHAALPVMRRLCALSCLSITALLLASSAQAEQPAALVELARNQGAYKQHPFGYPSTMAPQTSGDWWLVCKDAQVANWSPTTPADVALYALWKNSGKPMQVLTAKCMSPDGNWHPTSIDVLGSPRLPKQCYSITATNGSLSCSSDYVPFDRTFPPLIQARIPQITGKYAPVRAQFSVIAVDPSSTMPMSYKWDFGDGSFSETNIPAVAHDYKLPGSYTWRVTVTNVRRVPNTTGGTITIDGAPPEAQASFQRASQALEPFTFEFSAAGSKNPYNEQLTYEWAFGDGKPKQYGMMVRHTFDTEATHRVTLTVTDPRKLSASTSFSVPVVNAPPQAEISVSRLNGSKEVHFAGFLSSDKDGHALTYLWTFGDNTTSSERDPTHRYERPGTYHVRLRVTDTTGAWTEDQVDIVVVAYEPQIDYKPQTSYHAPRYGYEFSAARTKNPLNEDLTYQWDFGDGTPKQIGMTVNHTFPRSGSYGVTLLATDKRNGSAFAYGSVHVVKIPPKAIIEGYNTEGVAPLMVSLGAGEVRDIVEGRTIRDLTYLWTFDDGEVVRMQSVSRRYERPGTYFVRLRVTDPEGAWDETQITIKVSAPAH